jgi:hypothetical protein
MRLSVMIINKLFYVAQRLVTAALLSALVMASAAAEDGPTTVQGVDADTGKWKVYGQVYLWGASISGKTKIGDVDVPIDDIVDKLEGAFMGNLLARKDRWVWFLDTVYLNVSGNKTVQSGGPPATVDAALDLKTLVATGGGGYRLTRSETASLHILGGVRYLKLDADVALNPVTPPGPGRSESESDSNTDAVIGLRGAVNFSEKWYMNYYADIGAGGSDLTWQALAAINYRFRPLDIALGYRYLYWDFEKGSLIEDLDISGPYAGVKWRF